MNPEICSESLLRSSLSLGREQPGLSQLDVALSSKDPGHGNSYTADKEKNTFTIGLSTWRRKEENAY